jgi:hypothetical protein
LSTTPLNVVMRMTLVAMPFGGPTLLLGSMISPRLFYMRSMLG